MKEKLLNNLGLKIISLVLAFGVWMAVVNISNPTTPDHREVTLDVLNREVLEDQNLTWELASKDTVTVYYEVKTTNRSLIRDTDFYAYIDLKDYSVTGSVPVTVEVNKEKSSMVNDVYAKPMVVRIETEEMQEKTFELSYDTTGAAAEGYTVGAITLSPSVVTVRGPESQIGQINHMGVEINVDGAAADLSGETAPKFYDGNGNEIPVSEKVTIKRGTSVHYSAAILKSKDLTLDYNITGDVADGYRFTGVESSSKTVSVVGTKSVLANISTLSITDDKLDLTGASSDKTVYLNIKDYLPSGVSLAGEGDFEVEVVLKIEPLTTKSFNISLNGMEMMGVSPFYTYSFSPDTVEVKVRGLAEDLDTLKEEDIKARIDVDKLEPGSYPGVLEFELSEGFEIASYSEFEAAITSEEESGSSGEVSTAADSAKSTTEADVQTKKESD